MFGVHWGEPTGPGRTGPLSLFFTIVHLVMFISLSYGWFDSLGLNVFLLSQLCRKCTCFVGERKMLDDTFCFAGFSKTSLQSFLPWWCFCLSIMKLTLSCSGQVVFNLRRRCGWYDVRFITPTIPCVLNRCAIAQYLLLDSFSLRVSAELSLMLTHKKQLLNVIVNHNIYYCPTQQTSCTGSVSVSPYGLTFCFISHSLCLKGKIWHFGKYVLKKRLRPHFDLCVKYLIPATGG